MATALSMAAESAIGRDRGEIGMSDTRRTDARAQEAQAWPCQPCPKTASRGRSRPLYSGWLDLNFQICEGARLSRDPRFDGRFFIGVKTTGIYCRPICPARAPKAA